MLHSPHVLMIRTIEYLCVAYMPDTLCMRTCALIDSSRSFESLTPFTVCNLCAVEHEYRDNMIAKRAPLYRSVKSNKMHILHNLYLSAL